MNHTRGALEKQRPLPPWRRPGDGTAAKPRLQGRKGFVQRRGSVLPLVGLLGREGGAGRLGDEGDLEDRLGPVHLHLGVEPLLLGGPVQESDQLPQHVPGEIAAPPVEDQGLFLANGLEDPPAHLLLLGKGQLLFPVEEPVPLGAGGGMC